MTAMLVRVESILMVRRIESGWTYCYLQPCKRNLRLLIVSAGASGRYEHQTSTAILVLLLLVIRRDILKNVGTEPRSPRHMISCRIKVVYCYARQTSKSFAHLEISSLWV